jgi:hypothetical protein
MRKKKERFSGAAVGEKGNKRKKGSRFKGGSFWHLGGRREAATEKKIGVFFFLVRTGAAREKTFFLLLNNYSSKAGFLSLAAFGRRFLLLFSVFFFISYFQFVLEDD